MVGPQAGDVLELADFATIRVEARSQKGDSPSSVRGSPPIVLMRIGTAAAREVVEIDGGQRQGTVFVRLSLQTARRTSCQTWRRVSF